MRLALCTERPIPCCLLPPDPLPLPLPLPLLLRLLGMLRLLQEVCDRWTEKLRGIRFDPEHLYHIREQTFTTVEGPRIQLPFQMA
jgi:hypothetical protein